MNLIPCTSFSIILNIYDIRNIKRDGTAVTPDVPKGLFGITRFRLQLVMKPDYSSKLPRVTSLRNPVSSDFRDKIILSINK